MPIVQRIMKVSARAMLVGGVLLVGDSGTAFAEYTKAQIEQVPVERLVQNLSAAVRRSPHDPDKHFALARVHAMAWATGLTSLDVRKRTDELWVNNDRSAVPFANRIAVRSPSPAAAAHLRAAIMEYELGLSVLPAYDGGANETRVVQLDQPESVHRLGLAWCLDQVGEKSRARQLYRDVAEAAWRYESSVGPKASGHPISAEAARYLLALLDEIDDRDEIALWRSRLSNEPVSLRRVTPIVIPLRDGLRLRDVIDMRARVLFDLDGSGAVHRWPWPTDDAAWLIYRSGDAPVTSGLQLFGSVTFWVFWETGYQALCSLDDNDDGEIAGDELANVALWHDTDRNGRFESSELVTLSAAGVAGISCSYSLVADTPTSTQGVRMVSGTFRPSWDVIVKPLD